MPEALLNLAKHLTPDASATIRKRGQEYFNKGRVSPLSIRNRKVRATVEGESLYSVQIAAVRAPAALRHCPQCGREREPLSISET